MQPCRWMVIPVFGVLLLCAMWSVALQWVEVLPWLCLCVGVSASLLAVAIRRGVVSLAALALALVAWALLLASTLATPAATLPQAGLARLTVEPLRTACGLRGCWSEARLIRCSPVEPNTCSATGTLLSLTTDDELPIGGRATVLAKVAGRPPFQNPPFSSTWPDLRPAVRALAVTQPRLEHVGWLAATLQRARRVIRQQFDATLPMPHAGIARALLLGEGSAVEPELNTAIRNAGVSHVLAVSGMHVTVLVGGLVALLRWLWLRTPLALLWEARRVAAGAGACLSPLVASLCGGSPSAVRAAWTSTLMFALTALGRRPSALSVSALAVGLHVAMEPRDVVHPGFVLSVVATAALLTASLGTHAALARGFLESARAWLSTAPFLLLCFGSTSLVAVAANVLLLPLGGVLIPLALWELTAAFLGLDAWLGARGLFEATSGAFVGAARLCASLEPVWRLPPLTPAQLIALSLAAGMWLLVGSWRVRIVGSALALAWCVGAEHLARSQLERDELQVVFLDVGQGDATLIQTGDGKRMLIDAGGTVHAGPDPGALSVLPVLAALRISKLDVVVLSHPHPDHYGGLRAVLEAVPVAELWDTGQAEAEGGGAAQAIVELARARGAKVRRPSDLCRATQALGSAHVEVLAPCPGFDDAFGPNDNSFVLRISHGERSFLFTGDVEHEAEAKLVREQRRRLASDVLKVAHHGSRTSSTSELLAAVHPWLSVISAGRGNRFGHPHQEVTARLASQARHVLRIDEVGGVSVLSDGQRLEVNAFSPSVRLTYAP